jgi:protein-tyrosine kinase
MSIIEKAFEKLNKTESLKSDDLDKNEIPSEVENEKNTRDSVEPLAYKEIGSPQHEQDLNTEEHQVKQSKYIELDLQKLKLFGYLSPGSINIAIAEQYRRIKRPLLINAFDTKQTHIQNHNLIVVTSSIPKEGKSFTSLNLALSVAMELNQTALLIDADVARKSTSRFIGLENEPGLTDLLLDDESDLSNYLYKTNIEDLTVLPAGTFCDNINELWASNRMSRLIEELSGRYKDRVVIIDTSPVLSDSSTNILTRQVGQVLFVIEAEKTPQNLIDDALQLISDSQYIGLMLNKSNRNTLSDYSYYGRVNLPNKAMKKNK